MDVEDKFITLIPGKVKVGLKECINLIPIIKSGGEVKILNKNSNIVTSYTSNTFLINITKYFPECLEIYLKEGLIPERFKSFQSAIIEVVDEGDCRCLQLLLEYGFDVNLTGSYGKNALHICCGKIFFNSSQYWILNKIILLLKFGINIDILDDEGMTPLHYAIRGRAKVCIVEEILNKASEKGNEYVKSYVNIETKPTCHTALYFAFRNCDIDLSILLLKYGADMEHNSIKNSYPPIDLNYINSYLEVKNSLSHKKNMKGISRDKN